MQRESQKNVEIKRNVKNGLSGILLSGIINKIKGKNKTNPSKKDLDNSKAHVSLCENQTLSLYCRYKRNSDKIKKNEEIYNALGQKKSSLILSDSDFLLNMTGDEKTIAMRKAELKKENDELIMKNNHITRFVDAICKNI